MSRLPPLLLSALLAGCEPAEPVEESPSPTPTPGELDFDLQPYTEVRDALGVGFRSPPPEPEEAPAETENLTNGGGGGLLDLDADGDLDLVLTAPWGTNAVYLNDGTGAMTAVEGTGLEGLSMTSCVSAADFDADGLRDLVLCADQRVFVFRNLGGGRFAEERVLLDLRPDQRAEDVSIVDYDGDGEVDLYVCTQGLHELNTSSVVEGRDRVLRGLGDLEFEDVSDLFGAAEDRAGLSFASTWFDADEDGDIDLFVVKDRGGRLQPTQLFLNPGDATSPWPEVGQAWGLDIPTDGMGVAVGDFDGDRRFELGVSDNWGRLHIRTVVPGGFAEDRGAEWGALPVDLEAQWSSWAVTFPDVDNDGDQDLAVAYGRLEWGWDQRISQNGLWLWEDGGFVESSALLDQPRAALGEAWRGVLAGDLDGDGGLELVFTSHVGPVSIQSAPATDGAFLEVAVQGPPGNPDALGSRVDLYVGEQRRTRWIGASIEGIHSVTEPVARFGLGAARLVDRVVVRLPDGTTFERRDLPVNERVRLAP